MLGCLGGVQRVEPGQVGLARDEQVVHQAVQAAQERGRVRGVPRLLRRPERPRLGQLALPLLGERLGDGLADTVRVGPGGRDGGAAGVGGVQLGAERRDLPAQPVHGVQGDSPHGHHGGEGDQQGKGHGAH